MSELSWLPREGARGYRVDLLGPSGASTIEAHHVTEPRLPLAAIKYGHFVTRFRVATSRDGSTWEAYLPPVAIPGHVNPPLSEIEWETSGAPAYRILVRDDTRGEIVFRDQVTGPPAPVPWEGLDPTHPHRVRVQEWRADEWQDLHRYWPLPPPAELGGEPVAQLAGEPVAQPRPPRPEPPINPAAARKGVAHWVAVHLSALPPGAQHGEQRPAAWWEARLSLLEAWTIPALRAADGWVIVADRSVPADVLREMATRDPAPAGCLYQDELAGWQADTGAEAEVVAVTHLIAGDRLHPSFDEHVRQHASRFATRDTHAQLVTFPMMALFDRERGEGAIERSAVAAVHTVLRHGGHSALAQELRKPFRPFSDSDYPSRQDAGITAVLRAWPGPNATSAIHGELIGAEPGARLEATFLAPPSQTAPVAG